MSESPDELKAREALNQLAERAYPPYPQPGDPEAQKELLQLLKITALPSEPFPTSRPAQPLDADSFKKLFLTNDPIPNFDYKAVPRACPEVEIDIPKRLDQLREYLRENIYPGQQKNIMAVIEMYERRRLPKPNTRTVCLRDGKIIMPTVDTFLTMEPVWTEVCLYQ
jgi:hypothetical protein